MRVIIAGSRTIDDYKLLCKIIATSGLLVTEVVSGGAEGVDQIGERWANERRIPVKRFDADWERYGKSAGRIRNAEMAEYGQALVAITNGSPGTRNMIALAKHKELPSIVVEIPFEA